MQKGLSLLLAAAAAYGYYKYSKMSPTEKSQLKQKAKNVVDKNVNGIKNMFAKKSNPTPVITHNGY